MIDHPRDTTASIQSRLTNKARELNMPFGEILQYYGMERFLYRFIQTKHKDKYILKGGLIFYSLGIPLRRLTRDIDFLSLLGNQKEIISQMIKDAVSVSVPDDGMNFDLTTLVVEITQVNADRNGVRAKFLGYLGRSKVPIQIDFGFSDEITSQAVMLSYPMLLDNMTDLQIMGYPVESVIAEKFHAMVKYADIPSRWKDYYDIWLISENFTFDDWCMQKAISKTFERRDTIIPHGRPISLTIDFAAKHHENWTIFLRKSGLVTRDINDFVVMIEKLWAFLEWPLQGLTSPNSDRVHRQWIPGDGKWK